MPLGVKAAFPSLDVVLFEEVEDEAAAEELVAVADDRLEALDDVAE
jgi:hypothetical protein